MHARALPSLRRIDVLDLVLVSLPIGAFIMCQAILSASLDEVYWNYYGTFAQLATESAAWALFLLGPATVLVAILALR